MSTPIMVRNEDVREAKPKRHSNGHSEPVMQNGADPLLLWNKVAPADVRVLRAIGPSESIGLTGADPILFWNEVALEANRISHTNGMGEQTGPPLSARALAIVHLAMYDAYAGVSNDPTNLPPYLTGLPTPGAGATAEAAVAAAAYTALAALFPSQITDFDARLAEVGDPTNAGHTFGVTVAQQILADRAGDPNAGPGSYTYSSARGKHRPDPDHSDQVVHAPLYGAQSKGFAITARHELAPPPLDNPVYLKALREVRGHGCAPELIGTLPNNIEARTAAQTLIGIFWGYDGRPKLGTPPRLYNQIVQRIAIAMGNSVAENARLFALINVAMADAGILAWDQKYIHNFWRPVVGIREHDKSMGPAATMAANAISNDCDAAWLPLGAPATNANVKDNVKNFTPNFPAYPSGHATFGAAALHMTRLFYNVSNYQADSLLDTLDFVSEEFNGINQDNRGTVRPRHLRSFPDGLWQMIEENGRSRIYLGVHWVFDAFAVKSNGKPDFAKKVDGKLIGGVPLGLTIAEDIFNGGRANGLQKSAVGPRV